MSKFLDLEGLGYYTGLVKGRYDPQIEEIKNNILTVIENNTSNQMFHEKSTYESIYNGYFDATVGFVENSGYESFVLEVKKNTSIYTILHNSTYFSICVYSDSTMKNGVRYRYNSTEDSLPYVDNPLTLISGQYVAFTTAISNNIPLNFITILTNYTDIIELGNNIHLNNLQIKESVLGKANLIKYNSTAVGNYTESVDIYFLDIYIIILHTVFHKLLMLIYGI